MGRGQAGVQCIVVVGEADEDQGRFAARGPRRPIVVAGYGAVPADYRKPVQEAREGFGAFTANAHLQQRASRMRAPCDLTEHGTAQSAETDDHHLRGPGPVGREEVLIQ